HPSECQNRHRELLPHPAGHVLALLLRVRATLGLQPAVQSRGTHGVSHTVLPHLQANSIGLLLLRPDQHLRQHRPGDAAGLLDRHRGHYEQADHPENGNDVDER
ncbi:unnamed protein product, partial [Lymnaea stagnalis]